LSEGYYLVGTGSTGVGLAYGTIGLLYTCALLTSTFAMKRPYVSDVKLETDLEDEKSVTSNMAIKTPQFWQLFGTATLLSTGGMGLMSVAKPMITEIFSCHQPDIVTAAFATGYLMAMSSGNLFGRFGWAALSDRIGRRLTFNIFCGTGLMVYTSIPFLIQFIIENPGKIAYDRTLQFT
jgi:MFS family permease